FFDVQRTGFAREMEGAEDVVAHAFHVVGLHHWDVLVGCAMVDGIDLMGRDRMSQKAGVADGAQCGNKLEVAIGTQLTLDLVEAKVVEVAQHQLGRVQLGDSATERRADGASRAGDHDHAALDRLTQKLWNGRDRRAAEEIINVDVTDVADQVFACSKIGERWQDADLYRETSDI